MPPLSGGTSFVLILILLQIDEKVEQAIKELEIEAKKSRCYLPIKRCVTNWYLLVLTPATKRLPPELAPMLSNVYETLQATSQSGFITESLLNRLIEFLPFKVYYHHLSLRQSWLSTAKHYKDSLKEV